MKPMNDVLTVLNEYQAELADVKNVLISQGN